MTVATAKAYSAVYFRLLATLIALIALILGFFRIGHASLWYDEGFTAIVAGSSWGEIFHVAVVRDPNMAIYHVILHGWVLLLGDSEAALRSLSAVAFIGSVLVIMALGRRLHGDLAGLAAGLMTAVAPLAIIYSREARSYELMMFLVTLASYCFVVMVHDGRRWAGAGYAVTGAIGCYSHVFAGLALLAHALSLGFLDPRRVPWRRLAVAAAGLGALVSPLALRIVLGSSSQIHWIPAPRTADLIHVASEVSGGGAVTALCALLVLFGGWRTLQIGRSEGRSPALWRSAFGFTCLVVPYAVALAVSITVQPVFVSRYLIVCLPALALVVGAALADVRPRSLAVGMLALVVTASVINVGRLYHDAPDEPWRHSEDWRAVAGLIERLGDPLDGVVLCPADARPAFEYYVKRLPAARRPIPLSPSAPWETGLQEDVAAPQAVTTWARGPRRIWVVRERANLPCGVPVPPNAHARALERSFGEMRVERYDR